jgi:hypothetical protein
MYSFYKCLKNGNFFSPSDWKEENRIFLQSRFQYIKLNKLYYTGYNLEFNKLFRGNCEIKLNRI